MRMIWQRNWIRELWDPYTVVNVKATVFVEGFCYVGRRSELRNDFGLVEGPGESLQTECDLRI